MEDERKGRKFDSDSKTIYSSISEEKKKKISSVKKLPQEFEVEERYRDKLKCPFCYSKVIVKMYSGKFLLKKANKEYKCDNPECKMPNKIIKKRDAYYSYGFRINKANERFHRKCIMEHKAVVICQNCSFTQVVEKGESDELIDIYNKCIDLVNVRKIKIKNILEMKREKEEVK